MNKLKLLIEDIKKIPNLSGLKHDYQYAIKVNEELLKEIGKLTDLKKKILILSELKNFHYNENEKFKLDDIIKIFIKLKIIIKSSNLISDEERKIKNQIMQIQDKLSLIEKKLKENWNIYINDIKERYYPFLNVCEKTKLQASKNIRSYLFTINSFETNYPKNDTDLNQFKNAHSSLETIIINLDLPKNIMKFLKKLIENGATIEEFEEIEINQWLNNNVEIKKMLRLKI